MSLRSLMVVYVRPRIVWTMNFTYRFTCSITAIPSSVQCFRDRWIIHIFGTCRILEKIEHMTKVGTLSTVLKMLHVLYKLYVRIYSRCPYAITRWRLFAISQMKIKIISLIIFTNTYKLLVISIHLKNCSKTVNTQYFFIAIPFCFMLRSKTLVSIHAKYG